MGSRVCGLQYLQHVGSVFVVLRLSCPQGMWNLPRPGMEPVSPALPGRFLTTGPPGSPICIIFDATVNGISFSISFSYYSLLVYGNKTDFCVMTLYPSILLNLLIITVFSVKIFIFLHMRSSAEKILLYPFQFGWLFFCWNFQFCCIKVVKAGFLASFLLLEGKLSSLTPLRVDFIWLFIMMR